MQMKPFIDTQICDLFTAIWEYRKTASVFHLAEWWRSLQRKETWRAALFLR